MKKRSPIRPFLAHLAGGQETPFYLRMALQTWGQKLGQVHTLLWPLKLQNTGFQKGGQTSNNYDKYVIDNKY